MDSKTTSFILKLAVCVLAGVVGIVVITMMIGIFMPNEQVSNDKIFEMIGPAFNTVIGAFVGLLGGLSLNNSEKKEEAPPAPPVVPTPPPVEEVVEEDDGIDHSQPLPMEEHKDDNRWSDDHHDEHLADHVVKHS
jgi:hypothetical protein